MIGLFGGTFSPIHFGHINLALSIKEACQLDEIWFIPALVSPFRTKEKLVSAEHRLKMTQLAVEDIPGFSCLDIEIKRQPPSYTIDTITQLESKGPLALILSDDVYEHFDSWKEADQIKQKVKLLIGSRYGKGEIKTPMMEISATQVRERLKKRLYCGHLLPAKVLDYIYQNQLYFNP